MENLKTILYNFDELKGESQEKFINLLQKKELKKSDKIVNIGEVAENFFLLTKGVVRSYFTHKNGKEHTRTIYTPFTTTGALSSLILKKPSDLDYECLTDCELFYGNFHDFRKLTSKDIHFANQYSKILEKILLRIESRVFDLSVLNATQRYLKLKKDIPDIENLIAQYHIASYLNITPVQLSRIRKEIIEKRLY